MIYMYTMPTENEINMSCMFSHLFPGTYYFAVDSAEPSGQTPVFLFTENETNQSRLSRQGSTPPAKKARRSNVYTKDAFHDYLVNGSLAEMRTLYL